MIARADEQGLPVRTPRDRSARGGVVNVGVGPEADKICHALLERDVCTDYRGDGLRISPHFFNTEDDIDRCFEELRRCSDATPGDRTSTGTRWTMLFEKPCRFHGCSVGCVFPAPSVARQQSSNAPGSASHVKVHGAHANGDVGSPSVASVQVAPPSTLTSTRSIRPHPDQARPRTTCRPASTIRLRVRKSGNPGGIEQRARVDPGDRLARRPRAR